MPDLRRTGARATREQARDFVYVLRTKLQLKIFGGKITPD